MPYTSHRKLVSFAVLLLAFSLYVYIAQAKTLILQDIDDSSHLCLYVGDTLTIKLTSNPSTGFSWAKPEPVAHLSLVSSRSERGSSTQPGASGFQIFTYEATRPGDATLALNYLRPFEKNTPPARTFHLTLTIEERPSVKPDGAAKP